MIQWLKDNWFKVIKYIPTIVFAFVEIGFVTAILDSAYSDTNLMAGLGILYATIRGNAVSSSFAFTTFLRGLTTDLVKIRERIRKDEETDNEWKSLKEANKKFAVSDIKLLIRSIGIFLIFLICLSNIL